MSESVLCVQAQKSLSVLSREVSLAVQGAVLDVTSPLWQSMINCCRSRLTENFNSLFRWQILLHGGCALQAFWLHHLCSDPSPLLLS